MARKLTAAERVEYAEKAIYLSSRGMTNTKIAEHLGINRRTVAKLIAANIEELAPNPDAARAESLRSHREIIASCWRRINASGRELAGGGFVPMMHPNGMAGLFNVIQSSQKEIDKLRGVAPPEHLLLEHEMSVADLARRVEREGIPPERRLRLVDEDYTEEAG